MDFSGPGTQNANVELQEGGFADKKINQDEALLHPGIPNLLGRT